MSKIQQFRQSKRLVIFVVFIAMMLDLIMLTTLEPILPDILYHMEINSTEFQAEANSSQHLISMVTEQVGIVIATKPIVEILANLFVGWLIERCGHKYPLIVGCLGNFSACMIFAYGRSFPVYVIGRFIQALGSSLSVVSGLALIATTFTNDATRTRATSIAFGGLAFGIVVGFPFGSITYQFLGQAAPFLILSVLSLLDGGARLVVETPQQDYIDVKKQESSLLALLKDPYIIITLVCNFMEHVGLGMVIATEPAWMLDTFRCEQWQIGVILVCGAILQFAGQYFCVEVMTVAGRWFFCSLGLLLTALGYVLYPCCETVWQVLAPEMISRVGLGFILAVISPFLGFLVDTRHGSKYGAVFGLYASSYNLGFVVGPIMGGVLLHVVTFTWLYRGCACALACCSCLCVVLRRAERASAITAAMKLDKGRLSDFKREAILYGSTSSRLSVTSINYPPLIDPAVMKQKLYVDEED